MDCVKNTALQPIWYEGPQDMDAFFTAHGNQATISWQRQGYVLVIMLWSAKRVLKYFFCRNLNPPVGTDYQSVWLPYGLTSHLLHYWRLNRPDLQPAMKSWNHKDENQVSGKWAILYLSLFLLSFAWNERIFYKRNNTSSVMVNRNQCRLFHY